MAGLLGRTNQGSSSLTQAGCYKIQEKMSLLTNVHLYPTLPRREAEPRGHGVNGQSPVTREWLAPHIDNIGKTWRLGTPKAGIEGRDKKAEALCPSPWGVRAWLSRTKFARSG
jgi:hypothetical protein